MPGLPLRLEHRQLVAQQAEPAEPIQDRLDRRLGRAHAVGILDPQEVSAAVMAGEQPVEQSGPGTADVQETCRRRSEPCNYTHD
jgi:hypothetical protein